MPTAPKSGDDALMQQLSDAVSSILLQQHTPLSFETLYRMVETLSATGKSSILYNRLRQQCSEHLHRRLTELLRSLQLDTMDFLTVVSSMWRQHCDQMILIRSIYVYLDRTYALVTPDVPCIWCICVRDEA